MAYGNPGIKVRTDANRARIILDVRAGVPKTVAARRAGIDRTTLWDWRKAEPEFDAAILQAEAEWLNGLLEAGMKIALNPNHKDSAHMITWFAERRAFQFFARKEVTKGHIGDPDDDEPESVETTESISGSSISRNAQLAAVARLLSDSGYVANLEGADSEVDEMDTGDALATSVGTNGRERTNGATDGVPPDR